MADVHRHDRRPVYQQIADDLREKINTGQYAVGAELPTLAELRQVYDVAEVTARNALALLDRQGVIAVRHGKRSIVLQPGDQPGDNAYAELRDQIAALNKRMDVILDRLDQVNALTYRLDELAAAVTPTKPTTRRPSRRSS